jgi:hypothetical protein
MLWFQDDRSLATPVWVRCRTVVKGEIFKRVYWMWTAYYITSWDARCKSVGIFLVGTPKGALLNTTFGSVAELMARCQALVARVFFIVLRYV